MARAHIYYISWFKEEGGNISADLSLFVLLYNTNLMSKIKFNDVFQN